MLATQAASLRGSAGQALLSGGSSSGWFNRCNRCTTAVAAITNDHTLRASSGLPKWLSGKGSACQCRRWVGSLGREGSLEEEMETHSSILA